MYLSGGLYKGHKIEVPKSAKPTLSKVRESVFNILNQFDFKNKKFLDMFSGSAIMALEAYSRVYSITCLEKNPNSIKIIKKNFEKLKAKQNIILCDAMKFNSDKFEIIYLDPPWDYDYLPIIKKAYELLDNSGVIIIEYDIQRNIDITSILDSLNLKPNLHKQKKYGRCLIDVLSFVKQ